MKTDVLTFAAIIFVVGLLASGLGLTDGIEEADVPSALLQGVAENPSVKL